MFASFDQVHEQVVEIQRVLGQRLMQRIAGLDVTLDREHQFLHGRLVVAHADDLERLHHRDAGIEHRGQLPGEERDVLRRDLALALEHRRFFANTRRRDALLAQVGAHIHLVAREPTSLDAVALLVLAFPEEGRLFDDSFGHGLRVPIP